MRSSDAPPGRAGSIDPGGGGQSAEGPQTPTAHPGMSRRRRNREEVRHHATVAREPDAGKRCACAYNKGEERQPRRRAAFRGPPAARPFVTPKSGGSAPMRARASRQHRPEPVRHRFPLDTGMRRVSNGGPGETPSTRAMIRRKGFDHEHPRLHRGAGPPAVRGQFSGSPGPDERATRPVRPAGPAVIFRPDLPPPDVILNPCFRFCEQGYSRCLRGCRDAGPFSVPCKISCFSSYIGCRSHC